MSEAPFSMTAEDDGPLAGLPSADRTLLARAPLEVAVVEVRFTCESAGVPSEAASKIRDHICASIGLDLSTIQPAVQQQVRFDLAPGLGAQVETQAKGWNLSTSDEAVRVTLMPDAVTIQVRDYERWSTSLRAPLVSVLEGVSDAMGPTLVHRTGLRYIDRFDNDACQTAGDWGDRIDDSLLGPVLNPSFGHLVRGAQQQVEMQLDAHHGALLRHGPFVEPGGKGCSYLLDIDVFNQRSGEFAVAVIVAVAEQLNRTALSLFQACLRPDYLMSLQSAGGGE